MLPIALPGLSNLWLILLKDTALISVVGFSELLYTAKQAAGSTREYLLFYLAVGAIYLAMTLGSNAAFRLLERPGPPRHPGGRLKAGHGFLLACRATRRSSSRASGGRCSWWRCRACSDSARDPGRPCPASGGRVLASVSRGFTTTIRGTPLLVQVYLIYYGWATSWPACRKSPELPLALSSRGVPLRGAGFHHQRSGL
jgi:ABC-type amino acid transport system permease subunit